MARKPRSLKREDLFDDPAVGTVGWIASQCRLHGGAYQVGYLAVGMDWPAEIPPSQADWHARELLSYDGRIPWRPAETTGCPVSHLVRRMRWDDLYWHAPEDGYPGEARPMVLEDL